MNAETKIATVEHCVVQLFSLRKKKALKCIFSFFTARKSVVMYHLRRVITIHHFENENPHTIIRGLLQFSQLFREQFGDFKQLDSSEIKRNIFTEEKTELHNISLVEIINFLYKFDFNLVSHQYCFNTKQNYLFLSKTYSNQL